jgi:hypothetical protein
MVAADDGQAVVGQHSPKLSRHHGVAAAQHANGRTSAPVAGKDVGEDKQPTRGEHLKGTGDRVIVDPLARAVPGFQDDLGAAP